MQTIIYAKKVIYPSSAAHAGQSLHMASAFGDYGRVLFYPGINVKKMEGVAVSGQALPHILKNAGLPMDLPSGWNPLSAIHKGIYGANFRIKVAMSVMGNKNFLAYARDITEGLYLSGLKNILPFRGKFIYEMHEVLHKMHEGDGRADWKKTFAREARVMKNVNGFIPTNQSILDQARELFDYKGPALVLPNGYHPEIFKTLPLFSDEFPWPALNEQVELLYTGSIQSGKGVGTLIEAMGRLPDRFHLRVIGAGTKDYLEKIHSIASTVPNHEKRIKFLGHVPQRDLASYCKGCHISVIPQQSKNFFSPLKLNESLAMGLPIVATPLEIFDNDKKLMHMASDTSAAAIASAVESLALDRERARALRQEGLKAAEGRTWAARAGRIMDFYHAIK